MVVYIVIAVIIAIAAILIYKRKKREKKMPAGLQIFNESGKVIFDLANQTTFVYGTVNTNGTNGSVSDSRIDEHTWIMVVGTQDATTLIPNFTIEKGKISWENKSMWFVHAGNVTFIYGAY